MAIGSRVPGYDNVEWMETPNNEADIAGAMESALADGLISGAVALHYPFPIGVTTIGRVLTPGRGKPLLIASSTGISAASRAEAMLRNAVLGIAVAKSLGIEKPTIGILNLDGAASIQRALVRLSEHGYAIHFGSSVRADGGSLLRGNDLLAGAVDVCVCDTLTGNVLMKLFSAFNTGGSYEALGWGYGPSVGENWGKIVSIIYRASGAPVVANALFLHGICYPKEPSPIRSGWSSPLPKQAGLMRLSPPLIRKRRAGRKWRCRRRNPRIMKSLALMYFPLKLR